MFSFIIFICCRAYQIALSAHAAAPAAQNDMPLTYESYSHRAMPAQAEVRAARVFLF
jgi:hypothetical protein